LERWLIEADVITAPTHIPMQQATHNKGRQNNDRAMKSRHKLTVLWHPFAKPQV